MSNVMSRSTFTLDLKPIVDDEYDNKMRGWTPLRDQLCKTISTKDAYYHLMSRAPLGRLVEMNERGSFSLDAFEQSYDKRYYIQKFGLSCVVSEEAIEDNHAFDFAAEIGAGIAKAEQETDDIEVSSLINNSTSTAAADLGPDGKPLLSTTHDPDHVSQSNRLAVDADLSETTLENLTHLANAIVDKRGNKGLVVPKQCIIHPDQAEEYKRITGGELRYATADNDINANRALGYYNNDPIMHPRFSDTDAVHILTNANEEDKGLLYIMRRGLRIVEKGDPFTESKHFLASKRFTVAFADWKAVVGTPGAA